MTDWDLLTPGIGLTSIGIVGVGISLSGIAKTFLDGMHAISLLTMLIGMIFLVSGLFKDGFPTSARAKSATFITLGFLVTFGFAAAVTVSTQVPSIYAYIGLMLIISVPASVLAVASFRRSPHIKALAVIFIAAAVTGGATFYAFGLVAPKPPAPEEQEQAAEEEEGGEAASQQPPPARVINATILAGASAQGNPDYDPEELTVSRGEAVSWLNEDNAPHTVTSRADDGETFDSSIIDAGDSWTLDTSPLAEGEYEYFCTLHPHMTAMLIVVAANDTAAAAPPSQAGNVTAQHGEEGGEGGGSAGSNSSNQSGSAGDQSAVGNNTTTPPAGGDGGSSGATVTTVSIVAGSSVPTNNEFYVPKTVETTVGSMVTWRSDDTALHTVTSGNAETAEPDGVFDSGFINKGQSFSFVFDKAGEYDYYCVLHPFMTGKVIVR